MRKTIGLPLENIVCNLCVIFCCIYIFFWESKFVHSGLTFAIVGVLSIIYLIVIRFVRPSIETTVVTAIVCLNIIGLLYTKAEFMDGLAWVIRLLIILLLYLALANSNVSIFMLLRIFGVLTVVFTIGVFAQYLNFGFVNIINAAVLKQDSFDHNLLMRTWGFYAGFSGYNIVSAIMAMMLMFMSLSVFYQADKRNIKIILLIIAIVSFLAIIIAQKRGVFVAALLAFVIVHWNERMHNQNSGRKILFFLVIIIVILTVYYFLQSSAAGELFLRRFNNSDDISTGRLDIAQRLISNWWDYLFFGNGPASTYAVLSVNAHNNYIQIFYENGIVGLFLYLIFFISNLRYAILRLKQSKQDSTVEYVVFVTISVFTQIGFLIYGLFGNPMNDLFIFLIYIIFSALPYSEKIKTNYLIDNNKA